MLLVKGFARSGWGRLLLIFALLNGFCDAQRKLNRNVPVGADVKHGIHFDCPEEFGYYPHPTDCTQYYVCVFGGALLESCTGGLMYSHELQTCDWPRNVGCQALQEMTLTTASSPPPSRSTEQRIRYSITSPTPPPPPHQPAAVVTSRGQSRQLQHHTQEIITKQQQQQQLYADAVDVLPPAEEIENDRQQRVYRGQPSTVGQVQRDRDGLRHTNAIPSSGRAEKIGVISFGTQQQPVQQYRTRLTDTNSAPEPPTLPVQSTPTTRTLYNGSQHYDPTQYDPYYALYDDDVELYRDVDYSQQYNRGQQTTPQHPYRGTQPPVQIQASVNETPAPQRTPYIQSSYSTQPQDVYQQATIQDYNEENYSVQQVDDQSSYRQPSRQSTKVVKNELNYYAEPSPKSIKHVRTTTTTSTTTPRPISIKKQNLVSSRSPSLTATANQTRPQSIIITLSATPGKNSPILSKPKSTQNETRQSTTQTTTNAPIPIPPPVILTAGYSFGSKYDDEPIPVPSTYKPAFSRRKPSGKLLYSSVVVRPAPFSLTKLPTADMKSITFQLTSRLASTQPEPLSNSDSKLEQPDALARPTESPNKREIFSNVEISTLRARSSVSVANVRTTPFISTEQTTPVPLQPTKHSEITKIDVPENFQKSEEVTTATINEDISTEALPLPLSSTAQIARKGSRIISKIHFGLSDTYATTNNYEEVTPVTEKIKWNDDRMVINTEKLIDQTPNQRANIYKNRASAIYDSTSEHPTTFRYAPYKYIATEKPSITDHVSSNAKSVGTYKLSFNSNMQTISNRPTWFTKSTTEIVPTTKPLNQIKYEPKITDETQGKDVLIQNLNSFLETFKMSNSNYSSTERSTPKYTKSTPSHIIAHNSQIGSTAKTVSNNNPTTTSTFFGFSTTVKTTTLNDKIDEPIQKMALTYSTITDADYSIPSNINSNYKFVVPNDTESETDRIRSQLFTSRNAKPFRATVELPSVPEILANAEEVTKKDFDDTPQYKPKPVQLPTLIDLTNKTVSDSSRNFSLPARASRVNTAIKSLIAFGGTRRNLQSTKCNDNQSVPDSKCNEIHKQRTNTRGRGSAHYTAGTGSAIENFNRGTPASRSRPTLKPSTSIVSKATEFVDIYRYPPYRPGPLYPQPQVDKLAAKCRKDVCLLPDCSCGGKEIPGNLPEYEVPQIVLLTFDDGVNDLNKDIYSELFEQGRKNPNGCPLSATFYVSHEWTDYGQVQSLYADGHEMASHTVSHSFGEQFSQKKWNREVAGQREILAAYGGVHLEDVRGMRAPFLSVGGNKMFKMLYDSNFTYDSSMPVYENKPPSWPYTLDYKLFHDCMIPPCPTRSYPGVWEVPMVMWQDLNGGRCSMGDACSNPPDADGVYKVLTKNFERHYTTNRAPFGLFYHAAWFTQPHHKEGFIRFLDDLVSMNDVFLVTNWQAIQWVRDPTPLSRISSFKPFQCNYPDRPKRCNNPKVCNLWHKSGVRYMKTCQPCPDIYPWTGKTGIRSSRIDNDIED